MKEKFYRLLAKYMIVLTEHTKGELAKFGMLKSDRCQVTLKRFLRRLLI